MGLRKLKQGIIGGLAPVVERANVKKNEDDAHSRRLQYLREQAGMEFEHQKTLDQYSFDRDMKQKEYEFNRVNERKMKLLDEALREGVDPTRKLALLSMIDGMSRENLGIQTQAEKDKAALDADLTRAQIRNYDKPDAAQLADKDNKVRNLLESFYAFGTKFYEDGTKNPNYDAARAETIKKQLMGLGYDLGAEPSSALGGPSGASLPRLNLPGVGKPTGVKPLEYPFGRRELSGGGFIETDRTRRATQASIDKSPTSAQRKNMAEATEYLRRNPSFAPTFKKLVNQELTSKGITTQEAIANIMGNWPTVLAALEESGTTGPLPEGTGVSPADPAGIREALKNRKATK